MTATFKWTAESRLDTVIVGGQTIGYRYNAAGQLVRKDVNGTPQSYFLWDGDNLLAELNGSGTGLVAEYSYYPGLDNPHAIVYNGVEYDAHRDALGNVVALTDSLQNEQRTYTYDAWGNLTGGIDALPFNGADWARWKGALWIGNEANLYYMRNRWYEPATGRFLSEDPIRLNGGVNMYQFANADPVDNADPTGKCTYVVVALNNGDGTITVQEVLGESGSDCPNSGSGQNPACPSILNQGIVKNAIQQMWAQTASDHREHGGWYGVALSATTPPTINYWVQTVPNPGTQQSIALGTPPPGSIASIHMHPNTGRAPGGGIWIQGPSPNDYTADSLDHVSTIVVSRDSLFYRRGPGNPTIACHR